MILCIDIGNSNIKCGIYYESAWKHHWRISTNMERTKDEYEIMLRQFLASVSISLIGIRRVMIACVVPGLVEPFKQVLEQLFGNKQYWLTSETNIGLEIRIENPQELGADIIANAVAGYRKAGKPCIVIDFGTALTFTAVNHSQNKNPIAYIAGVAIAPGIELAIKALGNKIRTMPTITLAPPMQAIGTNTIKSLQSGIIFGYTGMVEGMIRRIGAEMTELPQVFATGGMSSLISGQTRLITEIDPWLTLDGLRHIAENNLVGAKL